MVHSLPGISEGMNLETLEDVGKSRNFNSSVQLSWWGFMIYQAKKIGRKTTGIGVDVHKQLHHKMSLIQDHIPEEVYREVMHELERLKSVESNRNITLKKDKLQLIKRVEELEKSRPQINQNMNITINDSVVMDTTFDNSIIDEK